MDIYDIFAPGEHDKSSDEYTVEQVLERINSVERLSRKDFKTRLDHWLNHECDVFPRMRLFMSEQPKYILEVPEGLANEMMQANQIPREFIYARQHVFWMRQQSVSHLLTIKHPFNITQGETKQILGAYYECNDSVNHAMYALPYNTETEIDHETLVLKLIGLFKKVRKDFFSAQEIFPFENLRRYDRR